MDAYRDRWGNIKASKEDTGDALNGVLHKAYLANLEKKITFREWENFKSYLQAIYYDGRFYSGSEQICKDLASHDDMTGIVCLLTFFTKDKGIGSDAKLSHFWFRPEIFLYAVRSGKLWGYLGLPLLKTKIIISFIRNYKAKNGKLDTDGKLLGWLMFECFKWKWTKFICEKIAVRRHGEKWLETLFAVKFEEIEHPIRQHFLQVIGEDYHD